MKRQVKSIRYYRIIFTNRSPLSVGSGMNVTSDKDIIMDRQGVPYIPGTALAGLYQGLYAHDPDDPFMRKYFGFVEIRTRAGRGKAKAAESRIITYDAVPLSPDACKRKISIRDGVGLDEFKTADDGAKYDYQILEPGVTFVTYVEQQLEEGDIHAADVIARGFARGQILPGGKTMRGNGSLEAKEILICDFDLTDPASLRKWLSFDLYSEKDWEKYGLSAKDRCLDAVEEERPDIYRTIKIGLEQASPIAIRVYTTEVSTDPDLSAPDYHQMTYKDNEAVIPGTSWGGAFRAQMRRLGAGEDDLKRLFGRIKKKGEEIDSPEKSGIRFGETILTDTEETAVFTQDRTRTAIDRFSGGVQDKALYTEKIFMNGSGSLEISFDRGRITEPLLDYLAAAIADLGQGFLAVGGETSIGYGRFRITSVKVDDREVEGPEAEVLFKNLSAALKGRGE